jgi:hypothetical protein
MAQFEFIRTADEVLNRIQQNVAIALSDVSSTDQLSTIASVNKDYSVLATDVLVFVDAASGPKTVTLPASGTSKPVTIRKTDASGNAVTIRVSDASKINGGAPTRTLTVADVVLTAAFDTSSKGWWTL